MLEEMWCTEASHAPSVAAVARKLTHSKQVHKLYRAVILFDSYDRTQLPHVVTLSMVLLHVHTVNKGCLGVAKKGNITVVHNSAVLSLITDDTGIDGELRHHNGHLSCLLAVPVLISVLELLPSLGSSTTSTEMSSTHPVYNSASMTSATFLITAQTILNLHLPPLAIFHELW